MKDGKIFAVVLFLGIFFLVAHHTFASSVSLSSSFDTAAFSSTEYGSVVFATPGSALVTAGATPVTITSTAMTGQAWGNYVGWIQLNGGEASVAVTCSGTTATLSGYGWGENTSWVNFGPFTGGAASSQPTIDGSGNFSGSVWTENFGWLNLSGLKATASPCSGSSSSSSTGGSGSISGGGCTLPSLWDAQTMSCQIPTSAVLTACHDPNALNYNPQGTSDPAMCDYTETAPLQLTGQATAPTLADCPYFSYANVGSTGTAVKRIQSFLDQYMNAGLTIDGDYGTNTKNAVAAFQNFYSNDILKPWYLTSPTGRFYKTTAGIANIVVGCPAPDVYLEGPNVVHSFASFVPKSSAPKVTINP